jgi:Flp pilus assembly pilin Flp
MSTAVWKRLWLEDGGQDIIEYTLLLAFIGLTTAALMLDPANNINFVWMNGNTELTTAASAVTSR